MRVHSRLALLSASTAAILLSAPSIAQNSPGGFTLPEPTPTPTARPEVEGPADDTGAVPLAPQVIPTETPTSQPSALQPQPTSTPTTAPTTAPPSANDQTTPGATVEETATAPSPAPPRPALQPSSAPPSARASASPNTDTATDSIPISDRENLAERPEFDDAPENETADLVLQEGNGWADLPTWWWIAGGLSLILLLLGGWLFYRRRQSAVTLVEIEPPQVATGASLAARDDHQVERPRIDAKLEVVGATRSVMMFTLDYRLMIANRSDHAVRDLTIVTALTSAQRGASSPEAKLDFDRTITAEIGRIGPQQSHTISGQLQLPVNQLQVLRQGNKPLFVPLLLVTVERPDGEPVTRHYAIGLPSTASATRLHPIPLDTPPGGVPGLRARELKVQPA